MIKPKKKTILIIAITAVFLTAVGIFYGIKFQGEKEAKQVSDKTITFINENLLSEGTVATFVSMVEESGIYKLKVKVGTQEPEVYITKNGKLLFIQGAIDMSPATTTEDQTGQGATEKATCETLTKTEKPLLAAFVVSACPYGLQMQRILAEIVKNIPSLATAIKVEYIGAIVNNKITAMHGDAEAQENLRQICIREEQASKYWDYVGCYIKAGDSAGCLTTSDVNKTKLNTCMTDATKGIEYAKADFVLSDQYGVTGSPTLVLNGKTVSEFDFGGRTAEAIKTMICCGAQTEPDACSQALTTDSAAASFSEAYTSSGTSDNSASCQ
ncbi:MAG: hypothetical protein ABIG40_02065 [Parcubacteria group bacterium]